ncbi:Protein kinase domain family protein [Babesia bovis T2Bo]|uniref:Protein kinase domain-containing protein n=1 Tax=Babesia bovis TaxID=5865 RepID=A7ANB6_BABBO|nr:Protein kinase domain family protein [Babesia bovis T2Bo]EDO08050.1 Protein kinase domain family protein [Babesia bovis T2Bo]|eukprot:XP_001611618.1 hypothetical protein [Babesia bovis T2Bo]
MLDIGMGSFGQYPIPHDAFFGTDATMNSPSVICRVRKTREIPYNTDDIDHVSCLRGSSKVNLKDENLRVTSGSYSPHQVSNPILNSCTVVPKSVTTINSTSDIVTESVDWPPSSIGVLDDFANYVEINFADYRPLYERVGPITFRTSLQNGLLSPAADLRLVPDASSLLISQNSTMRVVYNAYWLPKQFPKIALKVAVKSVKDCNARDGRSIKREIGCHLYIYQKLMGQTLGSGRQSRIMTDDWPTSEVLGYYLDKKDPGTALLVTRKLFGPDFFEIIRSECSSRFPSSRNTPLYELNKIDWCIIALERVSQFSELGIRHNDLKPDNIVLDMYEHGGVNRIDVKVIDLGAASMEFTKEFTGGTSWYESPEQRLLEYYTKKHSNSKRAQTIEIDRSSDAWGIGLSVIEVLLGRRMVDHLRSPFGSGPPALLNPPQEVDPEEGRLWWNRDEYWTIPPCVWLSTIRDVLQLDSPNQRFPICAKAARYVFDHLMLVDPRERASVGSVAEGLRVLAKGEIARHM